MEVLRREILPGIYVLECRGSLLIGVPCTRLQLAVEDLLAEKHTRVVLDLTNVSRVDSGGLGKIVNCLSRLRMAGGTMHMAGVNDTVIGLFKLTKVDRIVKLFPTAAAAAQDIASQPSSPA
ncbi:MAG: STAS domain-containing protein [Acidobacteria bacterium]|nr:STAS domain-containing protein [Acidobacteriota bacterium]